MISYRISEKCKNTPHFPDSYERNIWSTSKKPRRPEFSVIAFGTRVEGAAIVNICELLNDSADWYINVTNEWMSDMTVYIGAFGYGGEPLARLDEELLVAMSATDFSRDDLKDWIEEHSVYLDADYPEKEPQEI